MVSRAEELTYWALTDATHRTGYGSYDLLVFKVMASRIYLLIQSLISPLYGLSLCSAGKTKCCHDWSNRSHSSGEHKACLYCFQSLLAGWHSWNIPQIISLSDPDRQSLRTTPPSVSYGCWKWNAVQKNIKSLSFQNREQGVSSIISY